MMKTSLMTIVVLSAGMAHAENVEIYVVDMLDNIQNGYCIDIAKGKVA